MDFNAHLRQRSRSGGGGSTNNVNDGNPIENRESRQDGIYEQSKKAGNTSQEPLLPNQSADGYSFDKNEYMIDRRDRYKPYILERV